MLDWLINLLYQNPALFFLVILAIVSYVTLLILLFTAISKKAKLGHKLKAFSFKVSLKSHSKEVKTIEDLYIKVIKYLKSKGILDEKFTEGFLAREKLLSDKRLDQHKRRILEEIFRLYEAKVYGGKRIENEEALVRNLLDTFVSSF